MKVEKILTAKEILEIVEKNLTVSQFAHGDFSESQFIEKSELLQEFYEEIGFESSWKEHEKFKEKHGLTPYELLEKEWKELGSPVIIGDYEEVQQEGGMDRGSDWYSVKYFKKHDVYIRTDGYYQSHHGCDFNEGFGKQVFPKKVQIIKYV